METAESLIVRAEKAFADVQKAHAEKDPLFEKKLSYARWVTFGLLAGLEQPDLNPQDCPSNEAEAKEYRRLRVEGQSIISKIEKALQEKSHRAFFLEHKWIFEVLGAGNKTLQQVTEALPDIDPDLIDRVMGTLQQGELLYTYEEERDGNKVVVASISSHGYIALQETCPEEYARMFANTEQAGPAAT